MLTISSLSQKGGAGKSTMSRLIATAYAASEWRVKIADFNLKQLTSMEWAGQRLQLGLKPEVSSEAFSNVKKALQQEPQYDLMVFDGRPDSDVTSLEIAQASNLIIIPANQALDDLRPQVKFAHELRSKGIDHKLILFVLNQTADSQIASQDARDFVSQAGYEMSIVEIPFKIAYQIAQNGGRAITETTFPSLNERATSLAEEISSKIKALTKVKKK